MITGVVKSPRSISSPAATTVISVLPNEPPWKHPPPPGLWEEIDRSRIEIGWSRSKLSTEAGLTRAHYGNIGGTRGNWESVQGDTQQRLIRALVEKGGVPRERFLPSPAAPQRTHLVDTAAMLEKAARAYARIAHCSEDDAWLAARGVKPTELTVEGYLEAMLTRHERPAAPVTRSAPKPPQPPQRKHTPRPSSRG